jgi:excisionase family DNA binding protein
MNLVDAIRKAAQQLPSGKEGRQPLLRDTDAPTLRQPAQGTQTGENPEGVSAIEHETLQTVRFEVRLTNQQLHDLLGWLARTIHPVMTLREAAHYLRLRVAEVETLAEQGAIPGIKVDGRWRFLKNALDEWLLLQKATELQSQERVQKEGNDAA